MSSKVDPKKAKMDVSSKSKGKVGEWVRHMSSSGKEYYYNVSSHASQWEKPREWLDYEKKYGPVPNTSSSTTKPPYQQVHQSQSHPASQNHQQSERDRMVEQQRERYSGHHHGMPGSAHGSNYPSTSATYSHHSHASSSNSMSSSHTSGQHHSHGHSHSHGHHPQQTGFHGQQQQQQQRHAQHYDGYHERYLTNYGHSSHTVTSSAAHGGSHNNQGGHGQRSAQESTPSSSRQNMGALRDGRKQYEDQNSEDMDISPAENSISPASADSKTLSAGITSTSQQSYDLSRDENKSVDRHRSNNGVRERDRDRDPRSNRESDRGRRDAERGRPREREPRSTDHERSRSHVRDERSQSPWDKDGTPERQDGGESTVGTGMNSMGRLSSLGNDSEMSALAPLPPSLAVYYREDLIQHVKSLTSDPADRQASRLGEELMTSSAIQLSKVSTELKMARSLVRLTDIQATLQEQRILFLREQIRNLEESDKDNSAMLGVETAD
ncbi:unnamed protein product [Allacma fusca]|uniref:WW domain-containing protein n=1 Tax=Allacma fusca TaxID=39272 RepID=A0A8J2P7H9_9HEXA|nr:unnamed protein product [Allacma fusca]